MQWYFYDSPENGWSTMWHTAFNLRPAKYGSTRILVMVEHLPISKDCKVPGIPKTPVEVACDITLFRTMSEDIHIPDSSPSCLPYMHWFLFDSCMKHMEIVPKLMMLHQRCGLYKGTFFGIVQRASPSPNSILFWVTTFQ